MTMIRNIRVEDNKIKIERETAHIIRQEKLDDLRAEADSKNIRISNVKPFREGAWVRFDLFEDLTYSPQEFSRAYPRIEIGEAGSEVAMIHDTHDNIRMALSEELLPVLEKVKTDYVFLNGVSCMTDFSIMSKPESVQEEFKKATLSKVARTGQKSEYGFTTKLIINPDAVESIKDFGAYREINFVEGVGKTPSYSAETAERLRSKLMPGTSPDGPQLRPNI